MNIEEILLKLGVDASTVGKGLRDTETKVSEWVKALKSKLESSDIGGPIFKALTSPIGLATTALTAFAFKVKSTFDEMTERAKDIKLGAAKSNMSMEDFQPIFLAGQGAGVDPDILAKAMNKVAEAQHAIVKEEPGADKLASAFADLGVTLEDIKSKDYHKLFLDIAQAMHVAEASTDQLTAMTKIFGERADVALMPFFKRGMNNPLDQIKSMESEDQKKLLELAKSKKINQAIVSSIFEEVATGVVGNLAGDSNVNKTGMLLHLMFPGFAEASKLSGRVTGANDIRSAMETDHQSMLSQPFINQLRVAKATAQAALYIARLQEKSPEVKKLDADTEKLHEQHLLKSKSLQEQLNDLSKQKAKLEDDSNDKSKTALERAQARNDIEKKNLEIDQKKAEVDKVRESIRESRANIANYADEMQMSKFGDVAPTIHELAQSRVWMRDSSTSRWGWQNGAGAGVAQEYESLKADEASAWRRGDKDRANADYKRLTALGPLLKEFGIETHEMRQAKMEEHFKQMNVSLNNLLIKAGGNNTSPGIHVVPVMGS